MKTMKTMKTIDATMSQIVKLHWKYFMPLQYHMSNKEYLHVCVRCIKTDDGFQADVIVFNEDNGHEFMDGGWYHNADGIGYGKTLKSALNDLLRKTNKTIKLDDDGLFYPVYTPKKPDTNSSNNIDFKIQTTYPVRKIPYVPSAVRNMPFNINPVKH